MAVAELCQRAANYAVNPPANEAPLVDLQHRLSAFDETDEVSQAFANIALSFERMQDPDYVRPPVDQVVEQLIPGDFVPYQPEPDEVAMQEQLLEQHGPNHLQQQAQANQAHQAIQPQVANAAPAQATEPAPHLFVRICQAFSRAIETMLNWIWSCFSSIFISNPQVATPAQNGINCAADPSREEYPAGEGEAVIQQNVQQVNPVNAPDVVAEQGKNSIQLAKDLLIRLWDHRDRKGMKMGYKASLTQLLHRMP